MMQSDLMRPCDLARRLTESGVGFAGKPMKNWSQALHDDRKRSVPRIRFVEHGGLAFYPSDVVDDIVNLHQSALKLRGSCNE